VFADGPRAAWPRGLTATIAGADPAQLLADAEPHALQAPLTAMIAARGGFVLSFLLAAGADAAAPLLIQRVRP
jgi:hypothetical protein